MTQAVSRRVLLLAGLSATGWLTACSTPHRSAAEAGNQFWSGRMALQLQDDTALNSNGPQSFSASFELRGSPQAGSLQLFTPLGSSVALISWQPGSALLQQGTTQRTSASLDELVRDTLGTQIPVPALFAWLQGQNQAVDGWSVDLERYADGRIAATRHSPTPAASLRLILDR